MNIELTTPGILGGGPFIMAITEKTVSMNQTEQEHLAASSELNDPIAESELFSKEELFEFRKLLVEQKKKILDQAAAARRKGSITLDTNEMMDEVDLASATIEQNLTFRLLDRDRKLLSEVERALDKIRYGEYGYCEGTGEPIPKRRLELAPWTRHSVKHKEHIERMKKNGRGVADEDE